jgi:DNA-binding PadR family transcriptional regulator
MRNNTLAVLTALSTEPDKALYGLEIYDRTGLLPGTTYPILLRAENAGWVRSYWGDGDPADPRQPRRRYCQITDQGIDTARKTLAQTAGLIGFARRWLGRTLRPTVWFATSDAAVR